MFTGVPVILVMLPALILIIMLMIWSSTRRTSHEKETKRLHSEPKMVKSEVDKAA
jgi:cytochrome c-type biogenesis protein CcmH/NrfF